MSKEKALHLVEQIADNEDENIINMIDSGNLHKELAYKIYSIDEGNGGYKYIIYKPQKADEGIDIKNELDTLNGVMLDLVYYKKLFSINKFNKPGVYELKELSDVINLGNETIIGDKLIGKTVDFGVFKNVDEVDCVYEVFEINKEYGGGYGFFVWDLNGNLNRYYNYKEYVKTLKEVEDLIFFERIALETHQLVQGNYSSPGPGPMGSNYFDYVEKQGFFSKIINFFMGL